MGLVYTKPTQGWRMRGRAGGERRRRREGEEGGGMGGGHALDSGPGNPPDLGLQDPWGSLSVGAAAERWQRQKPPSNDWMRLLSPYSRRAPGGCCGRAG